MAARKKFRFATAAVFISCPYCGVEIEEPAGGSFMWTIDDLTDAVEHGQAIRCPECWAWSEVPKRLANEMGVA